MSETQQKEDLWGYAKRLDFVERSIAKAFPGRSVADITILDVGCGTGSQLGVPLARVGFNYVGVDTHKASIEEANRLAADIPNAKFSCCAVGELQAGPFDVVILSE